MVSFLSSPGLLLMRTFYKQYHEGGFGKQFYEMMGKQETTSVVFVLVLTKRPTHTITYICIKVEDNE